MKGKVQVIAPYSGTQIIYRWLMLKQRACVMGRSSCPGIFSILQSISTTQILDFFAWLYGRKVGAGLMEGKGKLHFGISFYRSPRLGKTGRIKVG